MYGREEQVKISGWYTDIQWTSDKGDNDRCKEGSGNSFIFVMGDDMSLLKLRCTNKEDEVFDDKDLLCCFGFDIYIVSDCNINYNSNSLLGSSYEKSSANESFALAGSPNFKVLEMEVYKVL